MRSIPVACLIAPLAAPVAFFLALLMMSVAKDGWVVGTQDWQVGMLSAAIFVLPVSYLATWLLGMPYIYWLRRRLSLSTPRVCAGAICCGVFGMWLFQEIDRGGSLDLATFLYGAALGAALAVCVATMLCWMARIPLSAGTK